MSTAKVSWPTRRRRELRLLFPRLWTSSKRRRNTLAPPSRSACHDPGRPRRPPCPAYGPRWPCRSRRGIRPTYGPSRTPRSCGPAPSSPRPKGTSRRSEGRSPAWKHRLTIPMPTWTTTTTAPSRPSPRDRSLGTPIRLRSSSPSWVPEATSGVDHGLLLVVYLCGRSRRGRLGTG